MYFNKKTILFCFTIIFLPFPSYAWNAMGHMLVANIAYHHLKPEIQKKIENLVKFMHQQYPEMNSFIDISYWPDTLRSQKIETYTHWHYIDVAFSIDGTPLKNLIDEDNALWALHSIQPVVKNADANPYERVRFLSFLTHLVGDLHQPLHTVSYISATMPDGDKGGNRYMVKVKNTRINLHHVWDDGLGSFEGNYTTERINQMSNDIMAKYPENYFGEKVKQLNPDNWVTEGMENAKKFVYSTPENQELSAEYIEIGKQKSEL